MDKEDYLKLINTKPKTKRRYILLYLPVDYNNDVIVAAKKYAKQHRLKLVEFNSNFKRNIFRNCNLDAGIEDFLSAIYYADCIFTNSFHAICFSIIFKKEFYVFSRAKGIKLNDILSILNLTNRYFNKDEKFICQPKIDYNYVDKNLKAYIEFSKNWITKQLTNSIK